MLRWELFDFNRDVLNGFQSSDAFYRMFYQELRPGSVSLILAHSLGNQVTLDMLRLSVEHGEALPPTKRYVMFEAAVPRETLYEFTDERRQKRSSWVNLFRRSIRSDMKIVSVYNNDDNTALGAMAYTHRLKKLAAPILFGKICGFDGIYPRTPEDLAACYVPEELTSGDIEDPTNRIAIGYGKVSDLNGLSLRQIDSNNPFDLSTNPPNPEFKEEHSYFAGDPFYNTWNVYQKALRDE